MPVESCRLFAIKTSRTATYPTFLNPSGGPTEVLYGAPVREITYQVAALNIGPPTFMRAPGEQSGSFALESAIDEMAYKLNIDPLQFRILNHAASEPLQGHPFSLENLLELLPHRCGKIWLVATQNATTVKPQRQATYWLWNGNSYLPGCP